MKINELILREEWTPTPEQEKWLGNADRKDPYILARMPGEKPPLSYFKDPDDQAKAKELNVGTSNLNTVKSVVGGKPDEPIFSTSPNNASSNFGTFGTSRGVSGTNQAGKDPGPGTDSAPYKFEPYPDTPNQAGNSSTDSSDTPNQAGNSSTDSSTTANQAPDAAAQAERIADRMDAEAGANTAGGAAGAAAAGNLRGKSGNADKDIGPAADLTTALTQLNNILKKYKVTTESRNTLKRRLISENLHEFSPAEQIRIFTILIENKPEQLNEFIAPLVRGLGRLVRGGSPGARNRAAQAARRAAITAQSTARRTAAAAARNPMRSIGSGLGKLGKAGSVGLGLWGAYEGGKALWDWWNNKEEKPEDKPPGGPEGGVPGGGPEGGVPGGGPEGGVPGGGPEGGAGQAGTVGQAVAAGFISKEDVDIIKKQLPILVRYFGLDTTDADLKVDIKATIDGIEDLREKAMSGQLPALAVAATDKPWGKSGDPVQDIGPLPKRATVDGKTYERPTGWPDKLWRAYLTAMKKLGFLMKDEQ